MTLPKSQLKIQEKCKKINNLPKYMQQFVDKLEKSKQLTQKQESKANVYITRKKKSSKKKSSKKDNSKKITNDKPFSFF